MKKLFALVTLATFYISGFSQASTSVPYNGGHYGHSNPAIKQYVKEHIMPVLLQKRQLVEKELTTSEKNELVTYRTTLKQLAVQRKEQMQQKPKGVSMHEFMQSNEQKALAKQMHVQVKQIMQNVQVMANNHLATLDNIHSQLEPSRKQWTDDISNLKSANAIKSANTENTRSQHMGWGKEANMFDGQKAYARFLLMPAQATTSASSNNTDDLGNLESLLNDEATGGTGSGGALTSFQVVPNPASSELVTGNQPLPSQNEFKLLDMQGRVSLSLQNIQPAQHIDISQVPSGTYIAQLAGGGQSVQNKIVISR